MVLEVVAKAPLVHLLWEEMGQMLLMGLLDFVHEKRIQLVVRVVGQKVKKWEVLEVLGRCRWEWRWWCYY